VCAVDLCAVDPTDIQPITVLQLDKKASKNKVKGAVRHATVTYLIIKRDVCHLLAGVEQAILG
jgi:hypothetical protein